MELVYIAPIAGIVAIAFAAYFMNSVLKESPGNERMQELSQAIFEGAMAFLNRQYKTLIPFTVVIFAVLF
ncbi:MAG: sodium/proton-translocating pyrophosphatase, partial [Negativicutes bacterium]|nr:sodium/proton-translocating pyrophosphatase [Negativicutes bacterium]